MVNAPPFANIAPSGGREAEVLRIVLIACERMASGESATGVADVAVKSLLTASCGSEKELSPSSLPPAQRKARDVHHLGCAGRGVGDDAVPDAVEAIASVSNALGDERDLGGVELPPGAASATATSGNLPIRPTQLKAGARAMTPSKRLGLRCTAIKASRPPVEQPSKVGPGGRCVRRLQSRSAERPPSRSARTWLPKNSAVL